MGLIDFLKNAGRKLGIGDDDDDSAVGTTKPNPTPEDFRVAIDRRRAAAIARLVRESGLHIDQLVVEVKDDLAIVSGQARSQADREKVALTVGNIDGIARVDDRITVMQAAANTASEAERQSEFYTVQKGDTLSKIAKHYYGDANKYPQIFEANRPMLSDPDKIYPGQVLRIPGAPVSQRA